MNTLTELANWAKRPANGLLIVLILLSCTAACSSPQVPVNLKFVATWNGQTLNCNDSGLHLTDLRFYVSTITLIDTNGKEHELKLAPDGQWQQEGLALIDLENGEGGCSNGSPAMNSTVSGVASDANFAGLRFTLGVPFERNHANPLTAPAPLNDAAMHWHWRSGYKFMRAGVANETDSFWMHLGSTGCEGTVQNITGCRNPNRTVVELSDFSPATHEIELDLSALFLNVDLHDGDRSDCSSGPAEDPCAEPFAALGIGPQSKPQSVFRAR